MEYELGIIGAGNMAEAIVRGILRAGLIAPARMVAADVSAQRRALFQDELGIEAAEEIARVVRESRTILLSTKPQQMGGVLEAIGPAASEGSLFISIAAGISCRFIEARLGAGSWHVIRSMPNTPMLVGEGMVALARGRWATEADVSVARRLFEAAATVLEVPEEKMDAVTAMSGSGPAYFFFVVEQMIRAGIELGLTAEQAHTLASRTALGAARMMVGCGEAPEELRRKVTSPGGTTQAAIETMQARQVPEGLVAAIRRAAERSRELGS